jgi:hypothetical protein
MGAPARSRAGTHGWRPGLAVAASLALVIIAGCAAPGNTGSARSAGGGSPRGSGSSRAGSQGSGSTEVGEGASSLQGLSGRNQSNGRTSSFSNPAGILNGDLFGGDVPLALVEQKLGRNLAIVRVYYVLGENFPRKIDSQLMTSGSTLLVSLDTRPGGASYASIAAGHEDGTILPFLKEVNAAAVKYHLGAIYMTFEHEANVFATHTGLGTPAQFVQAWDHVHQLAVSAHLDWQQGGRMHWALILSHWAFSEGRADQYWPGLSEFDVLATDGYNTGDCQSGQVKNSSYVSPSWIFGPVLSFAQTHGAPPVFIAEWGSVEYPSPSVRPNFIHQMQSFVASNPEIHAAMYWNGVARCSYSVNNYPASLAALVGMAHASLFQGQIAPIG